MLDVYLPMMRTAAVLAAARLGVFAALARRPRRAAALAKQLGAPPHGIERLGAQLVAAGWLVRGRDGAFANAKHVREHFTAAARVDFTPGLLWTHDAWRLTADLDAAIARGGPRVRLWDAMRRRPELGERFAAYMRAFAQHAGPALRAAVPVPRTARRLLDVGGSHGLHAIAFCHAHPELTAVVFDNAASLRETRANIAAHGLRGRVTVVAGDCTRDDLGRGFDVVTLFSVLHNLAAGDAARVVRRCARALNPGGVLAVHDYVRGEVPEPLASAFDLTLLLEVGERCYALREHRAWVRGAGLAGFRHVRLAPPELGSVMTSRRPRSLSSSRRRR
jgi:SAM-dependent methyltransferase